MTRGGGESPWAASRCSARTAATWVITAFLLLCSPTYALAREPSHAQFAQVQTDQNNGEPGDELPREQRGDSSTKDAKDGSNGFALAAMLIIGMTTGAGVGLYIGRKCRFGRSPQIELAAPPRQDAALTTEKEGGLTPPLASESRPAPGNSIAEKLIEGLIATYDLATSEAQQANMRSALRHASITIIWAEAGEEFDPERHQALDTEPAGNPAHAGRVIRTVRPGWERDAQIIRFAEVIIGA